MAAGCAETACSFRQCGCDCVTSDAEDTALRAQNEQSKIQSRDIISLAAVAAYSIAAWHNSVPACHLPVKSALSALQL